MNGATVLASPHTESREGDLFLKERLAQRPGLLRIFADHEIVLVDEEHQNAHQPLDLIGMVGLIDKLALVGPAQLLKCREHLCPGLELANGLDKALFDLLQDSRAGVPWPGRPSSPRWP